MKKEEWRVIPSFPKYLVSSVGIIKNAISMKTLKARVSVDGYLKVTLWGAKGGFRRPIHILVADAFLGPRPRRHHLHHKDHDRLNNYFSSLEYICIQKHLKIHQDKRLAHCAKLSIQDVRRIRELRAGGMKYRKMREIFGITAPSLWKIVHKKSYSYVL